MEKKMVAIIPARGGSKGLPGKNIRLLNGKPLIQYTIEAALNASVIDEVVVSTDDLVIADIARNIGADVPFLRPDHLASDTASAVDVYLHAIEFLMESRKKEILKFMVLLPTAPLRTAEHIDTAYELFYRQRADTLISVKLSDIPPTWFLKMNEDKTIHNAGFGEKNGIVLNRQVNALYYVPNGAIYILDYRLLKEKRTYYSNNTVGFLMEKTESIDIDTLEDFKYAEYLIKNRNGYD